MVNRSLLRQTVLGRTPPASVEQVSACVYKVTLSDGLQVALKHVADSPAPDPLHTESLLLEHLGRLGCPVPEVHLVEPSLRVLVTAWAGDRTMDDLCQEGDQEAVERSGRAIAEGLCRIEAAMAREAKPDEGLVLNPDPEDEAAGILREAQQGAEALMGGDLGALAKARRGLERLVDGLRPETRSVASLDYNARNVVTDGDETRFIDFSTVGWDWPERRFVQYVTGLGAYRRQGRLVSPLTPELVAHYARTRSGFNPDVREPRVIRAVDAHDLLFHLLILARLFRIQCNPEAAESRLLRRAWDGLKERRTEVVRNLGRPLSDDPGISALRDLFKSKRE